MVHALTDWLINDIFMPQGQGFPWRPGLVSPHAVADGVTALAFYMIAFPLLIVAMKRTDLVARHVFVLSGLFVLAWGTAQAMGVWVRWNPRLGADGAVTATTAVVSAAGLRAMCRMLPRPLIIPGRSRERAANAGPNADLAGRAETDRRATPPNRDKESRVAERTAELEAANAELRRQVARERLLATEIHHRVKNNLQTISSMLRLQAESAHAEAEADLLAAQRRIHVMAQIHERLHADATTQAVEVGAYLDRLCRDLASFYGLGDRVGLEVHAEPLELDLDRATALALIANEAITNACAHAFPDDRSGTIALTLRCDATSATLTVADDGVGPPPTTPSGSASRTVGTEMMAALTDQLGGAHTVTEHDGTRVAIRFPLPAHADPAAVAAP